MISLLKDAGYTVHIASPSGQPFIGSKFTVRTELKLSEVVVEKYDGIIMACMSVGMPGPIPTETVDIVRKANSLGIPIAAQDANAYILSAAKLLNNVKYAFFSAIFPEGVYAGVGSICDKKIITSSGDPGSVWKGYPDQTVLLTSLFIQAMKETK